MFVSLELAGTFPNFASPIPTWLPQWTEFPQDSWVASQIQETQPGPLLSAHTLRTTLRRALLSPCFIAL